MCKDNEIRTAAALGTLLLKDINVNTINQVEDEKTLCILANAFHRSWFNIWAGWDYDNDDDWPFVEGVYSYDDFKDTAALLCKRLKQSQPLLCKAVETTVEKWRGEYQHLFEDDTP